MNPRSTLLLALVVAVLGAAVWYYEVDQADERAKAETADKRVFPVLEADAITAVELRTEDGKTARLERSEGVWRLVAPLAFAADPVAADAIAKGLADLTAAEVYDGAGETKLEPLASYGLEGEPLVRFTAGAEEHALRLGNASPVGGNTYATDEEGKRVFAIPTYHATPFRKSLKALRDARVISFDREAVEGVAVRWPEGQVALAKQDGKWRLVEPVAAPADSDTVEALLSDLEYLRADEFLDEPPPASELGLDAPAVRVELRLAGAAEPRALVIGAARGEARRVAQAAGPVVEIAQARLDAIPRTVSAYRFKELSRFTPTDAQRFELSFPEAGGDAPTIVGTNGDSGWSTAPAQMAPGKASALVSTLASLEAAEVAAESMGERELAGVDLAPARVHIRVLGAGEGEAPVLADVTLGRREPGRGIAAQRAGDPAVFWLSESYAEQVPTSLALFREKFEAKEPPAPASPPAASAPAPPAPADGVPDPAPQ